MSKIYEIYCGEWDQDGEEAGQEVTAYKLGIINIRPEPVAEPCEVCGDVFHVQHLNTDGYFGMLAESAGDKINL